MTQSTLAIGSRVRVTNVPGGAFYSHNYGKEGVVTELGDVRVAVRFDDGSSDYGRRTAVVVVSHSLKVGDKVKIVGEQGGLFYPHNAGKEGVVTKAPISDDGIVAVRFEDSSTDFGRIKDVALVAPVAPTPAKDEQGFISNRENTRGIVPVPRGTIVDVLYNDGTLDAQLAGLRAEMEVVKSSIATANRELEAATQRVATKQSVVDNTQEELAALVERVAKHGLKFVEKTAQDAHDEGKLAVGVTLLAVTPEDTDEHVPGKQYKIVQRDRGDTSEWKLESEDGYGWWIRNTELKNYTVVAY